MAKKQEKRRPASYYIDFENVRGAGLNGVENLCKGDKVVVLYGSKDSALKLEQVQNVLNSPATVEFIKVATGKHDALDFQLVALLFMKMKKKRDYYIISKDTGFDFAIRMAKVRGMDRVFRRETISGAKLEPKKLPQPKQASAPKRLPNPKKARALQSRQRHQDSQQDLQTDSQAEQPQQAPKQPAPQAAQDAHAAQAQQKPQQQVDQKPAGEPQQAAPAAPAPVAQDAPATETKLQSKHRRRKPSTASPRPAKDQYRIDVERVLARHLGGLPVAKKVDTVIAALEKCDTKARFYNFLRGNMGNEQGRTFYNELKGCFDDLRAIEREQPEKQDETE